MFDVAPTELLLLAVVALLVIGPKDLPRAMRVVGNWIGRARGMARHFRSGIDEMIRQSELEEMEKKWREENERIMREFPTLSEPAASDTPALAAPGVAESGPTAETSQSLALPAPTAEAKESEADLANWHAAAAPMDDAAADPAPPPPPAVGEEQYSLLPPEPPSAASPASDGKPPLP